MRIAICTLESEPICMHPHEMAQKAIYFTKGRNGANCCVSGTFEKNRERGHGYQGHHGYVSITWGPVKLLGRENLRR